MSDPPAGEPPHPRPPQGSPWPSVLLLSGLNALNFTDRVATGVLGGAIRRDLALSGGAFGVLTGFGFTTLYALAALPIARFAAARDGRRVLCGCVLVWSLGTLAGGAAAGFGQFLAARVLVGLGEAAFAPIAYALIARTVAPSRQALSLSVFIVGAPLGAVAGVQLLTAVAAQGGWRAALYAAGVVGLAAAPLALALPRTGGVRPGSPPPDR